MFLLFLLKPACPEGIFPVRDASIQWVSSPTLLFGLLCAARAPAKTEHPTPLVRYPVWLLLNPCSPARLGLAA